jgi:SET domain-containing protein
MDRTPAYEVRDGRPGTGKGLFARKDFAKGEFIVEYTGKKITTAEADASKSRYLFELDKDWTIEGPPDINIAGYINHSCDPNAEVEEHDGHLLICAEHRIKAEEEITIDYGQEYFDEFIKPVGCKCGAKKHRR